MGLLDTLRGDAGYLWGGLTGQSGYVYGPGSPGGGNPSTGGVGPGGIVNAPNPHPDTGIAGAPAPQKGTKIDALMSVLHQYVGAPYRHWGAGGTGLDHPSVADVRSNGESCTGILNGAREAIGLSGVGGVGDYIGFISPRENFDPSKSYPVGTVLIASPSSDPPEGHVAIVSGPNGELLQSTTYGDRVRNDLNYRTQGEHWDYAGPMPDVGTSASSPFSQQDASGIGGAVEALVNGMEGAIARALVRSLKYAYAYTVILPSDFAAGFAYELPKALYKEQAQKGHLAEKFWVLSCFGLTYWLAFGKRSDGTNYTESMLQGLAEGVGIEANREARQPKKVAVEAAKTGPVRVEGATRRVRTERVGETAPELVARRKREEAAAEAARKPGAVGVEELRSNPNLTPEQRARLEANIRSAQEKASGVPEESGARVRGRRRHRD